LPSHPLHKPPLRHTNTTLQIKEYLTTGKVELGAADPEAAAKREAIAKEGNKRQEAAIAFL
jgi:hypothetical protein